MRLVSSEISKQRDGLRKDSQIIDALNSVINEKVLPDIRDTITSQNPVIRDELDHRSSRLSRTAEEENIGNAWKNKSKPILTNSSKQNYFRENSDISQSSDEGHVMMTNSHDNAQSCLFPILIHWISDVFPLDGIPETLLNVFP